MVRGPGAGDADTLLFADHDEIRTSRGRWAHEDRDRPLGLTMRSWGQDLGRRSRTRGKAFPVTTISQSLGETVGGLARNLNNSLAAILAYSG